MDNTMIILAIFVSVLITFALRAIPFFVFGNDKNMPPKLIYLGKILPSAIMAVLVVYCMKDVVWDFYSYGIPELVASVIVVVTYKWKHNTLLSILIGTICNMLLLKMI